MQRAKVIHIKDASMENTGALDPPSTCVFDDGEVSQRIVIPALVLLDVCCTACGSNGDNRKGSRSQRQLSAWLCIGVGEKINNALLKSKSMPLKYLS